MKRLALFFSGHGSTLQAALDLIGQVHIVLGVTNKKNPYGKMRLLRAVVPLLTTTDFELILQTLKTQRIDGIYLLGYMKVLPESFLQKFTGDVINIHPSLLPLHPGLHGFEKSFANQDAIGATLHRVVAEVDAGPVVRQRMAAAPRYMGRENEARVLLARTEQTNIREVMCKI